MGNLHLVEVLRDLLALDLVSVRECLSVISGDSLCSVLKHKEWGILIKNDAENIRFSAVPAQLAPCLAAQAIKTLVTYGWTVLLTLSRWPVM